MSLQDQLLKAGLVDSKKAKQVEKEKRKQKKVKQKSKQPQVDETKLAAQQALEEKAQRDRELASQRNAEAEKKAIQAQIIQLIEMNRQPKGRGDVPYNFTDGKKVKKLFVTEEQQKALSKGRLVIVALGEGYELVPAAVADKIAQRDDSAIIVQNTLSAADQAAEEDDPYADFQIPDDLMW